MGRRKCRSTLSSALRLMPSILPATRRTTTALQLHYNLFVGHDERSGREPDIRPACPVASTLATGSRMLGVRQTLSLNSLNRERDRSFVQHRQLNSGSAVGQARRQSTAHRRRAPARDRLTRDLRETLLASPGATIYVLTPVFYPSEPTYDRQLSAHRTHPRSYGTRKTLAYPGAHEY